MVIFPALSEQFPELIQKVLQVLLKWQQVLESKAEDLTLVSLMTQLRFSYLPCSPAVQPTEQPSPQMFWQSPTHPVRKLCQVNWAKLCESWQAAVQSIMLEQQM